MQNRQPSWKHTQERRYRARRRLAAIAVVVFVAGLTLLISALWKKSQPGPVVVPTEMSAATEKPPETETPPAEDGGAQPDDMEEEMQAMAIPEPAESEALEFWGPPDPFNRITGALQSGQTLGQLFDELSVPPGTAQKIIQTLRGVLDMRRIRPQDRFDLIVDAQGLLLEFTYERGNDEIYRIDPSLDKWVATREKREFQKELTVVHGTVESTLFDAIAKAGEQDTLIMNFVEIFAWAIDFSVFTRKGDRFVILVEKLYDRGIFRGYGRIYQAEYNNAGHAYEATYYEAPDGFAGYFDAEGRNLRRAFLKAPLRFNAITSSFTYNRFHPVLKFRRPHTGIDYAAPTGTPIWSIADGIITGAGWMGGSGRAVKIRHRNGIETSYSHLSRFGKGIKKGVTVRQKQIIGYVGSSGLATGPHLHFGMKKNGRPVNPVKIDLPSGDPVPRKYTSQFQTERSRWLAELAARTADQRPAIIPAAAN